MTKIHSNLKSLPLELLQLIFKNLTKSQLCQIALVCKAWVQPAFAILYPNVVLSNLTQLRKFYGAIEHDPHLGVLVKAFKVYTSEEYAAGSIIHSLLNDNCLPYVERLHTLKNSYTPVLEALSHSKLNRLKELNEPNYQCRISEAETYAKCVLLMKDRLENLFIADEIDRTYCGEIFLNRVYDQLHQFRRLTTINFKIETNEEIEELEHVVESCPCLKEIKFDFKNYEEDGDVNTSYSLEDILKLTPRLNIKKLTDISRDFCDEKTFMYIIHKFPQLEEYVLETDEDQDEPIHYVLDQHTLTRLLGYLHNVKTVDIRGLIVDEKTIAPAFRDYWDATASPGSQEVYIEYTGDDNVRNLNISRSKQEEISIQLFVPDFHGFLVKSGKFLKKIQITVEKGENLFLELSEDIMETISKYCPNLKYLHFDDAAFEHYSRPTSKKLKPTLSLDELFIEKCVVNANLLERFSQVLMEVKTLNLDVFFKSNFEIIMPHTKINLIILNLFANKWIFIKHLVTSENKYYYFRSDLAKQPAIMEDSNEEEYNNTKEFQRFYVSCQTKAKITFMGTRY